VSLAKGRLKCWGQGTHARHHWEIGINVQGGGPTVGPNTRQGWNDKTEGTERFIRGTDGLSKTQHPHRKIGHGGYRKKKGSCQKMGVDGGELHFCTTQKQGERGRQGE